MSSMSSSKKIEHLHTGLCVLCLICAPFLMEKVLLEMLFQTFPKFFLFISLNKYGPTALLISYLFFFIWTFERHWPWLCLNGRLQPDLKMLLTVRKETNKI